LYNFVGRVSVLEKTKELSDFQAFKSLNQKQLKLLGLNRKTYPIFINDKYTPQNYCALVGDFL